MKTCPAVAFHVLVLAAALLAPSVAFAQQDANVERGFAPGKLYERGISGIDHINEFSGSLLVTIPIGPSYSVNGGLSYGLTLVYNAKAWDMFSGPEKVNGPPVPFAQLSPHDNAGMGWRLTLGQLIGSTDPGNTSGLAYVGPDGGEHAFTSRSLHVGEPEPAPGAHDLDSRRAVLERGAHLCLWLPALLEDDDRFDLALFPERLDDGRVDGAGLRQRVEPGVGAPRRDRVRKQNRQCSRDRGCGHYPEGGPVFHLTSHSRPGGERIVMMPAVRCQARTGRAGSARPRRAPA